MSSSTILIARLYYRYKFSIDAIVRFGVQSSQHEGSSVDPARQQGPHAHSIMTDPANRYAFTPDLGLDNILIYKIDLTDGKLIPNDPPWELDTPKKPAIICFSRFSHSHSSWQSTIKKGAL